MLIDDDLSPFELRCAASCDSGSTRMSNKDRAFTGELSFAVADGFGAAGNIACVIVDVELDLTRSDACCLLWTQ